MVIPPSAVPAYSPWEQEMSGLEEDHQDNSTTAVLLLNYASHPPPSTCSQQVSVSELYMDTVSSTLVTNLEKLNRTWSHLSWVFPGILNMKSGQQSESHHWWSRGDQKW